VQHWHAPDAEHDGVPITHFLHAETTHGPPSPEPDEPELLPFPGVHLPALHTSPAAVQSVHEAPPVPHATSVSPPWHVPTASQHPLHVCPHVPPEPLLEDEALPEPPLEVEVLPESQQPFGHDVPSHAMPPPFGPEELPDAEPDPPLLDVPADELPLLEPLPEDEAAGTAASIPHMQGPKPLPSALHTW
jgi:hypothetical protein